MRDHAFQRRQGVRRRRAGCGAAFSQHGSGAFLSAPEQRDDGAEDRRKHLGGLWRHSGLLIHMNQIKVPLSISACAAAGQRSGIGQAARSNVDLLRSLVTEVEECPPAAARHGIIYQHGMPPQQPEPWMNGRHVIGYWVCESSVAAREYRACMDAHAEIWTASEASARALRALGSETPVHVIPHVVDVPEVMPDRRGRQTVTTLFAFAPPVERKNPEALIRAWRAAFPAKSRARLNRNARLIVKVRGGSPVLRRMLELVADGDERIEIIHADLSDEEMAALYARADIWCSMQRAGAFELHIAQAAASGLPIITTAVGGPLDYLPEGAAVWIGGREIPPLQDCPLNKAGVWMEPDPAQVITALRRLAASARLRREMGSCGREGVRAKLDADRVQGLMRKRLMHIATLPPASRSIRAAPALLLPRALGPLRPGLEVMGDERWAGAPETPLVMSHRRSGTHLLGELLAKHWELKCWLKTHDWPERRPPGARPVYVARNPVDCLHSTWRWWKGESGNSVIASQMAGTDFDFWVRGGHGERFGHEVCEDGSRDNLETARGSMYDPLAYWVSHVMAAVDAGIPIVLYEDLAWRADALHDRLVEIMGRQAVTRVGAMLAPVGHSPSTEHEPGKARQAVGEAWVYEMAQSLPSRLLRAIDRENLEHWMSREP